MALPNSFRETAFCELFMRAGYSQRQAACVERWLEDHRPGGLGPIHFVMVAQKVAEEVNSLLVQEQMALREQIEKLEEACEVFGLRRSALIQGR